jgi:thymidylate synthase
MVPHELIVSFGDVHIYNNHVIQCQRLLEREIRPSPQLILDDSIATKKISEITIDDFSIAHYTPHPNIKADMAI